MRLWFLLRSRYALFFLPAVALAYASEWVPYYVAALFPGELRVLGPISEHPVPCTDAPRGDVQCRAAYRVPRKDFRGWEKGGTLGLGIILYSTEAVCTATGESVPLLNSADASGQNTDYLNTYQTYTYGSNLCPGDLIIESWAPASFRRYGHVDAPMVIGSPGHVREVKRLIEFLRTSLLSILAVLLTAMIFFDRKLVKIATREMPETPAERFALPWLGYMALSSGVLNTLAPLTLFPLAGNRALHVFAWNAFPGTLINRIAPDGMLSLLLDPLPGLPRWLRISPLNALSVAVVLLPSYNLYEGPMILAVSLGGLGVALARKDRLLFWLSLAQLSDALKLLMVPHLPTYYVAMIFTLLCFAESLLERAKASAQVVQTLKWTQQVIERYHEGGKLGQLLSYLGEEFGMSAAAILTRGRDGQWSVEGQSRAATEAPSRAGPAAWRRTALDDYRGMLPGLCSHQRVSEPLRAACEAAGIGTPAGGLLSVLPLEPGRDSPSRLLIAGYGGELVESHLGRLRLDTCLDLLLPFLSRAVAQKLAAETLSEFLPQSVAERLLQGKAVRQHETGYLLMADIRGSTRIARRLGNDYWAEFTRALARDIAELAPQLGYQLQSVVWDAFYFTRAADEREPDAGERTLACAQALHDVIREACERSFGQLAAREGPSARFCLCYGDTTRDVRSVHKADWTIVGKTMAAVCKLEQACKELPGWLYASTDALPDPDPRWAREGGNVRATGEVILSFAGPPGPAGLAAAPRLRHVDALLAATAAADVPASAADVPAARDAA